ncbi:GTPase Era [Candidatus Phytoplasma prunorum]|uniref:GTPase Era n=1 Tax=Candidatus Phytoplasma prunorum TaxID=47565 RepID=UPI002FF2CA25
MKFKSGFITILGRPNVGKSTLINVLVKQKISIVSDKPNVTINKIIGICNDINSQLIFIDTPGFNNRKFLLSKRMDETSLKSIYGVDIILFLITDILNLSEKNFLSNIKKYKKPIILVINKIDNFKNKIQIDKIILDCLKYFKFDNIIPISAINSQNLIPLKNSILSYLKEGPKYYPCDMITDQKKDRLIAELVREKIFFYCRQEIPYSVGTMVERINYINDNLIEVWVLILIEKTSQKKILIGSKGEKLKQISINAAKEIQNILNIKVFLNLWIKTKPKWRENIYLLKQLGYY